MNPTIQKNKGIILAIAACLLIGGITMSFQNSAFGPLSKLDTMIDTQDTIPAGTKNDDAKMSIKDFDKLTQNMDKEMLKMQKEMTKIDFEKMHREITTSLGKVNMDKISADIDKAIKNIDFDKIERNVQSALKEIDWNKVSNDVKVSLQEAKKEIEKIDMESVKKEMEKARIEIEKSKHQIENINLDEIMKDANAGIAKAKEELTMTKQMFNEMEKDGLIDQKEGFTIDYKDKTLIINGKKQPESVRNKYQQYIKGDSFKISISKE